MKVKVYIDSPDISIGSADFIIKVLVNVKGMNGVSGHDSSL